MFGLNLQPIGLHGTRFTDAGLQNLLGMDRLAILVLADDNFSDFGLQYVGKLARLKLLNLNGARVSDAGLRELYGLLDDFFAKVIMRGSTSNNSVIASGK